MGTNRGGALLLGATSLLWGCSALLGADFTAASSLSDAASAPDAEVAPADADADVLDGDALREKSPLRAVSTARYNTFALFEDGTLWGWGYNGTGELGTGNTLVFTKPTKVSGFAALGKVVQVAPGEMHTCVLLASGDVYCVGKGTHGELGNGQSADQLVPVRANLPLPASSVVSGSGFSCAMLNDWSLWCWGDNASQELARTAPSSSNQPLLIRHPELSDPFVGAAVAAGVSQVCAMNGYGRVLCWGENAGTNVGASFGKVVSAPALVADINSASSLSAGTAFGCALLSDATVKCWGRNNSGQLGRGTSTSQPQPAGAVLGLADIRQVATAGAHACAAHSDGGLWCWGDNYYGQLGIGGSAESNMRQRVSNLPAVVGVTAAASHTCAWTADNAVFCWGVNVGGQLGLGTMQDSRTPSRVIQGW